MRRGQGRAGSGPAPPPGPSAAILHHEAQESSHFSSFRQGSVSSEETFGLECDMQRPHYGSTDTHSGVSHRLLPGMLSTTHTEFPIEQVQRPAVKPQRSQILLSATPLAQNTNIFSREPLLPKLCKLGHCLSLAAASSRGP